MTCFPYLRIDIPSSEDDIFQNDKKRDLTLAQDSRKLKNSSCLLHLFHNKQMKKNHFIATTR